VRTVLICDNEIVLRGLVRATLEPGGYTFVEAGDGDEALALARASTPDLIVLDVMMPGRSGIDVLETLRADPGLRRVPVVILTARAQQGDREAIERAGADRLLTKPFSPLELAAVVADLLDGEAAA
jgi:CheY-like chemotaxis protein